MTKGNITRINGMVYPSQRAAALALGIAPQAVSQALDRGTQDRVGTGAFAPVQCEFNGETFPSLSAAARRFKVRVNNVQAAYHAGRKTIRDNSKGRVE